MPKADRTAPSKAFGGHAQPRAGAAPAKVAFGRPGVISPPTVLRPSAGGATDKKLKFASRVALPGRSVERKVADKREAAKQLQEATAGSSGIVFNKGHGQHILRNPLVVTAIVEKSAIKPSDIVLEIGPGTGNLTEKLLEHAKKVIAFEIDPRMISELHKRFQNSPHKHKLTVVQGNCLDHEFPYFDKCVANVPYAISSALVFKLLRHKPAFKCAVLMFQREFALRVCAKAGTDIYCRLSVNSQLLARCSHLMKISKNSFNPPPKVESSVIRLDPIQPAPDVDFEEWDAFVKLLFNRKNKKVTSLMRTKACIKDLHANHVSYCKMASKPALDEVGFKALIETVLAMAEIGDRRARTMTQEDIMHALGAFSRAGVHFA